MNNQQDNETWEEPIGAQMARAELRAIYAKSEAPCDLSLRLRAKGEAMRHRMRQKGVEPLPYHVQSQTLRDCEPNAPGLLPGSIKEGVNDE